MCFLSTNSNFLIIKNFLSPANKLQANLIMPGRKPITKKKKVAPKKDRIPVAKKAKRAAKKKEEGLPQIDAFEQNKRVGNMNRDKEKYALVGFTNDHKLTHFRLINVRDGKGMDIKIKSQSEVSCSCMDWKMRCKKNNLICKHIIYILTIVLKVDHNLALANKISDWGKFADGFKNIIIKFGNDVPVPDNFKVREDRELTAEDLCAICLTDFMADEKNNLLNCLRCRGVVHKDCMVCWIRNAQVKACVYCKDATIGKIVA